MKSNKSKLLPGSFFQSNFCWTQIRNEWSNDSQSGMRKIETRQEKEHKKVQHPMRFEPLTSWSQNVHSSAALQATALKLSTSKLSFFQSLREHPAICQQWNMVSHFQIETVWHNLCLQCWTCRVEGFCHKSKKTKNVNL